MSESTEEKREAAAIRRRWITLGEVLAVVAVLISGATLWNSYQERKGAEADRATAASRDAKTGAALTLKAMPERDGRRLALAPLDTGQSIQSQQLFFPARLKVAPVETIGDARIEASWIAESLRKDKAGADRAGDRRVPVAIVTRFVSNGVVRTDAALYQLAYERDEDLLSTTIRLRGLSLIDRVAPSTAKEAVERR